MMDAAEVRLGNSPALERRKVKSYDCLHRDLNTELGKAVSRHNCEGGVDRRPDHLACRPAPCLQGPTWIGVAEGGADHTAFPIMEPLTSSPGFSPLKKNSGSTAT